MKQMRWRTILLVFWLTFTFNVERLDSVKESPFNLASSVYVLAAAAVGLFLLVPMRRRQMYLATFGVMAIYATFKGKTE